MGQIYFCFHLKDLACPKLVGIVFIVDYESDNLNSEIYDTFFLQYVLLLLVDAIIYNEIYFIFLSVL